MIAKIEPKTKTPSEMEGIDDKLAATYFHPEAIIGADGLNCCVRNGNRWFPIARTTREEVTNMSSTLL